LLEKKVKERKKEKQLYSIGANDSGVHNFSGYSFCFLKDILKMNTVVNTVILLKFSIQNQKEYKKTWKKKQFKIESDKNKKLQINNLFFFFICNSNKK
jgi:hypothetical protein